MIIETIRALSARIEQRRAQSADLEEPFQEAYTLALDDVALDLEHVLEELDVHPDPDRIPEMPNGVTPDWETEHYRKSRDENLKKTRERRKQVHAAGGRVQDDLEFYKLHAQSLSDENWYLRSRATQLARVKRSQAARELGKEYGKASRTIRALRDEVDALKKRLDGKNLRSATGFTRNLKMPSPVLGTSDEWSWGREGGSVKAEVASETLQVEGFPKNGTLDPWRARWLALALLAGLDHLEDPTGGLRDDS